MDEDHVPPCAQDFYWSIECLEHTPTHKGGVCLHPIRQMPLILLIFYRFFLILILIAGLRNRCAEKRKIVMAITETLRALVHCNKTTSPADMPVGFQKDRCSPRAAVFAFCCNRSPKLFCDL
jgi:hypothetical protein